MKVGITLPQFREDATGAIETARRAEALGLDGVFCFDHLWPMGEPGRPALSMAPLLGALAAATRSIGLGTLVARVGLVPDDVLVAVLASLDALSAGRLVAGIGTGDEKSRAENEAYGVPFEPAPERRARMGVVAAAVAARGIEVWLGGGAPATAAMADSVGAAVNVWGAGADRVAELVAAGHRVTWGGPLADEPASRRAQLAELSEAGASYAVCALPGSLEDLVEAARGVRDGPGRR